MPFYYNWSLAETTNGTANTVDTVGRMVTGASLPARIVGWYATGRETAAGGFIARMIRRTTAGTVGTSQPELNKHPSSPAAGVDYLTGSTAGSGGGQIMAIGGAGTGGYGGWVAISAEHAITLNANGGANGNVDVQDIGGAASVDYDHTVEVDEG